MIVSARIDELRQRYAEQPRRYFAALGNELRKQGALDEAITVLRDGLASFPAHLSGHVVLGQALFEAGELSEASEVLEQAAALDGGNLIVLRHLGEIARLRGDDDAAREWFGRLRTADPYADDVAVQLGGEEPPVVQGGIIEARGELSAAQAQSPAQPPAALEVEPPASSRYDDDPHRISAGAFELFEPIDFDPVVGLDAPPADPLPEPIRDQVDELFESQPLELGAATPDETEPLDATPPALDSSFEFLDFGEVAEVDASSVADGTSAASAPSASPFVTETMARLLESQGHRDEALAIYDQLVAQRPDDETLRARAASLRNATTETAAEPAGEPINDDGTAAEDIDAAYASAIEDARIDDDDVVQLNADESHATSAVPATTSTASAFFAALGVVDDDALGADDVLGADNAVGAEASASDDETSAPADASVAVGDDRLADDDEDRAAVLRIAFARIDVPAPAASETDEPAPVVSEWSSTETASSPDAASEAKVAPGSRAESAEVGVDTRAEPLATEAWSVDVPPSEDGSNAVLASPLGDAADMASSIDAVGEADPFADLSFDRFFTTEVGAPAAEALPDPPLGTALGVTADASDDRPAVTPAPDLRVERAVDRSAAYASPPIAGTPDGTDEVVAVEAGAGVAPNAVPVLAPPNAADRAAIAAVATSDDDEDLARFNAWLRGLAE